MADNSEHHTQKVTITKKTVKVTNQRDDIEFPKATKKDGRYILPWETTEQPPDGLTNFKYFFTIDESKVPNEAKLNEEPLMQLMTADSNRVENPPENGIRTTWLGHASVLFQLDNANILINPNFNDRGIKYYHPGNNKRYRTCVYTVAELPRIDCVLITNTHFDYLDLTSVRLLNERFGEMLLWYVPMGVADWMAKAGCVNVVEMDWWKEDEVDFIDHTKLGEQDDEDTRTTTFNIACTPSQSFHNRSMEDDNAALWCSWVIISPRYKLFISGATGYCEVFKSIGRRYGPFHMAALPIGGYHPSWKFGFGNVTPQQAVQIHQDVLAMCSLALSWGTFTISNEYYLEPPTRLNEELRQQGLSEMQFFLLKHGESRLVEIKEADKDQIPNDNGHIHENGHAHVEGDHVHVSDHEHAEGDHVHVESDDVHVESDHVHVEGAESVVIESETHHVDGGDVVTTTETDTETHVSEDGTVVTTTETVITTEEGETTETVTISGHTELELTPDDIPCMDDFTTEEEHHHVENDQDILQQLVDQFVEETQPEHHDSD